MLNYSYHTILGSFNRASDIDHIQELSWEKTTKNKDANTTSQESQFEKLLNAFPENSSFQMHANDDNKPAIKLQDADIPQIVKNKLNEMLNTKFKCIISKSSADFGRTNLVEMNLPTTGVPIMSKAYTIPLKYKSFIDNEIKLLEDVGCIFKSLSDWESPICIVKKKTRPQSTK